MSKKIQDPFAKREAAKYADPIPSREYILEMLEKLDCPISRRKLETLLCLKTDNQQEGLRRRLKAMLRDGQLLKNRSGEYGVLQNLELIRGRVIGQKDGTGLCQSDDGAHEIFLSGAEMRLVFDGDRVLVRVAGIHHSGRMDGNIVEILERAFQTITGKFVRENGCAYVIPENKRITQKIIIPKDAANSARKNQIVSVQITRYPEAGLPPFGKVLHILGHKHKLDTINDIVLSALGIHEVWPEKVSGEISKLSSTISNREIKTRKDLRDLPFVTIDGDDSKDFDDAVCCEKRRGGFTLYVAIADVSHYVKPKSQLDKEAFVRATSVYLPRKVVPMLPEVLSNDLCSLKPEVDRLVMVCEMQITSDGTLKRYGFYKGIIHSHARLTYNQVQAYLDGVSTHPIPSTLRPKIDLLYTCYQAIQSARKREGLMDFEVEAPKIIFGKGNTIADIQVLERTDAHRLIEACMLYANIAAATFLSEHAFPGLYRCHEPPTAMKLSELRRLLGCFALDLGGGAHPTPADYALLTDQLKGHPSGRVLQTSLLRSLARAVYTPENKGHYGLNFPLYTHFTSPIRRYPDLIVHRLIAHVLSEKTTPLYSLANLTKIGDHCSLLERRADEAGWQVNAYYRCHFMQKFLGETFRAQVVTVMNFGVFVALEAYPIEAFIHVTALGNDYYQFDVSRGQLRGRHSGLTLGIGDRLTVQIARVNVEDAQLDCLLIEKEKTK